MFFKKKPESQVERIKVKLNKVKEKDYNCKVFGSEKFGYKLNDVISMNELEDIEKKLGVTLPEHFRIFVTQLGNGGAGPYYGVYSLKSILQIDEEDGNYAKKSCYLYPNMSREYWDELVNGFDENISDEEYDLFASKLYGGLLKFGTQGCTCDMYLVVTGEYAGRIVYTDDPYEDIIFFFAYEENFLDWYERWLDEILLDYDTSWFGYKMGGDEFYLLDVFNNSKDREGKIEALGGFYKFKHISDDSCEKLEEIGIENFEIDESITILVTSVLVSINFNRAKKLLHKLLNSDNEEYIKMATDSIARQKNCNIEDFSDEILKFLNSGNETYINYVIDILSRHKEANIFPFKDSILNAFYNKKDEKMSWEISQLICKLNLNSYELFENWLQSDSKKLINNAVFSLKNVPYDRSYFETIKNILLINDKEINEKILEYLGVIEDERLLPYYKNMWNRYSGYNLEKYINYIKSFEDVLSKLNYPLDYFESDRRLIELLGEFNINLENENIIKIVNVSCIKNLERVFIIYFLKDKSKCVAAYDYSGNFVFETKLEGTKVPIYFMYDFTNVYVCALEGNGNVDGEGYVPSNYICTLNLDKRKITDMIKSWQSQMISERERQLIKLTL